MVGLGKGLQAVGPPSSTRAEVLMPSPTQSMRGGFHALVAVFPPVHVSESFPYSRGRLWLGVCVCQAGMPSCVCLVSGSFWVCLPPAV